LPFRIGFHVSIAGGIHNSVFNAQTIGCTAFQIFTRNPRGWAEKELKEEDINMFKSKLKESGIQKDSVAVHMPYLPNLSGPDGEMYQKSVDSFKHELIRCSRLGIEFLIIHLGSHREQGKDKGIKQLVKGCELALDYYRSHYKKKMDVTVLLENSASQKNSVGDSLEELRQILDKLAKNAYGICLDTCHAFASGYDLSTEESCNQFINKFDKIVSLQELKFIHLNDSKYEIGSHLDRHELVGCGKIGINGFKTIVNDKTIGDIPMVMEPHVTSLQEDTKNLQMVQSLRK
jgi:deoxyribonuclease IV